MVYFGTCLLLAIKFCACRDASSPATSTTAYSARKSLCQVHREAYARAFQNFTLWAVQMHDASAASTNGILAANNYHLGNFDECLAVNADLGSYNGGVVKGKYCLVKVQLGTTEPHSPPHRSLEFDPFDNAWNKIRPSGEVSIWRRDQIYWGICTPDSCNEPDIQKDIDAILGRTWFGEKVTATVNPSLCQTRESVETNTKSSTLLEKFTKTLFIVLVILVLGSTGYDYFADGKRSSRPMEFFKKVLLCFSMRVNVPSLLVPDSIGPLDMITGARNLHTVLVLYGHRWRMQILAPVIDSLTFEQRCRGFTVVTTGLITINSFFVFSGFLVGYNFYSGLEKREKFKKLNWRAVVRPIVNRVFRFTPLYAVVILLFMSTLPKLGSGPLWPLIVLPEVENCSKSWWTNLLYINNYIKSDSMCMYQSWYLSADIQLFIMAHVMLYIYKRNEFLGKRVFGYSIMACIIWHGAKLYLRDDPAVMNTADEQRLRKVPSEYYYINYYILTHFRFPPYMIGVLAGIYTWKTKDTPTKLTLRQLNLCSLVLLMACLCVQFLGHEFALPSSLREDTFAKTIYGCLHHSIWAACTIAIIVLGLKREGGIFQKFLSWTPFLFLNKLSFGVYLIHSLAQSEEFGSLRAPRMLSRHEEYWMFAGDIFFVYFFSFILSVLVVEPFLRLRTLILIGERKQGEICKQTETKKIDKCK